MADTALNINDTQYEVKVKGEKLLDFPLDLYIPPDALEVFLDAFEGPLDLLLYLIRKQNLDILDIPVADITRQYMEYVELMKDLQLELAAEYLLMAAMLAEIKSRMLLPRHEEAEEEEGDPRAELIRRLQEYERFKQAAENIDALPRLDRDLFVAQAMAPPMRAGFVDVAVSMDELLSAVKAVFERAQLFTHHQVKQDVLSLRDRMAIVLENVQADSFIPFSQLFDVEEGRMGVVITLMAILELIRQSVIELVQSQPFAPIHIKARA